MSILTQLKQKFDTFLSNTFNQSDDYCLILISKMLEELDLEHVIKERDFGVYKSAFQKVEVE